MNLQFDLEKYLHLMNLKFKSLKKREEAYLCSGFFFQLTDKEKTINSILIFMLLLTKRCSAPAAGKRI